MPDQIGALTASSLNHRQSLPLQLALHPCRQSLVEYTARLHHRLSLVPVPTEARAAFLFLTAVVE